MGILCRKHINTVVVTRLRNTEVTVTINRNIHGFVLALPHNFLLVKSKKEFLV